MGLAAAFSVAEGNEGNWLETLPWAAGEIYDNPDNPWFQSFHLGFYTHLHAAAVSGRTPTKDFWYGRATDWRRTRVTIKARALNILSFTVHANVMDDEGRDGGGVEFDYQGLFLAWATLDLKQVVPSIPLDGLDLSYGSRKLTELNEEMDTLVNDIITVERSSFAAQVVPFPEATGITGVWLDARKGANGFRLGVYSTDATREFGAWNDGLLVSGAWRRDFGKPLGLDEATVSLGGAFQDVEAREEVYSPWEWIVTPWLRIRKDRWELHVSGAIGENEGTSGSTGGAFYGGSVMPAYWVAEEKLQAVFRYEIMGSEGPRGVQLASRYAREAGRASNEAIPSLSSGRGDFHQSIYGGLVWHVVPKHMTLLAGVEWEELRSNGAEVYDGTTLWMASRLIF